MWDANSVKGSGGHMLVTGLSDKSLGADVSASQRKPGQSRGNSRCIGPVVIESQSSGSAHQAHGHTWQTWLAASDLKCFLPSLLSSPTHPLTKSVVLNQAVLAPRRHLAMSGGTCGSCDLGLGGRGGVLLVFNG